MARLSPSQLERKADMLIEAAMSPAERKAKSKRDNRSQKRSDRYQKTLRGNQWAITK